MYIIANPAARRGRGKKVVAKAEKALQAANIPYTLVWTKHPGHATELARAAAEKHDLVVAAGGDGTMHEVAMGLLGTDAALGIIPAGTGNDLYRSTGLSKNIDEAVRAMHERHIIYTDVGFANDVPFFNITACGLDMDLYEASLPIKKYFHGQIAYILALFACLPKFKPHPCRISRGDGPKNDYGVSVFACSVGEFFGGGMRVSPGALLNDGQMDVTIIHNYTKGKVPFLLPKFIAGKHRTLPDSLFSLEKDVVIESDVPLAFEVDGEIGPVADKGKPMVIRVQPTALKLAVSKATRDALSSPAPV